MLDIQTINVQRTLKNILSTILTDAEDAGTYAPRCARRMATAAVFKSVVLPVVNNLL